jgi:hypothetical protein
MEICIARPLHALDHLKLLRSKGCSVLNEKENPNLAGGREKA